LCTQMEVLEEQLEVLEEQVSANAIESSMAVENTVADLSSIKSSLSEHARRLEATVVPDSSESEP